MYIRLVSHSIDCPGHTDERVIVHTSSKTLRFGSKPWASFSPAVDCLLVAFPSLEVHINFQVYTPSIIQLFNRFLIEGSIFVPNDPPALSSSLESLSGPRLSLSQLDEFYQLLSDFGSSVINGFGQDLGEFVAYPPSTAKLLPKVTASSSCHICLHRRLHIPDLGMNGNPAASRLSLFV